MNRRNLVTALGILILVLAFLFLLAVQFFPQQLRAIESQIELTLTTPALLFPAISLLLLAYTNRFVALAQLVRELHARYKNNPDKPLLGQIDNLRRRIRIIRDMQFLGVLSFFFCVFCMFLIFLQQHLWAEVIFGFCLLLLMGSLSLSMREIRISTDALNIHLSDLENEKNQCDSQKETLNKPTV